MFVTPISKLSNSTYFSITFQSNEGSFRTGQLCLCPCTSFRPAVLTPDLGPASASQSAITTAVAAGIAPLLTIFWIAWDSAISVLICIFLYCLYFFTSLEVLHLPTLRLLLPTPHNAFSIKSNNAEVV